MINFDKTKLDYFYGVIRKYMQLRGALSQKDLASLTNTGISTMSRFLNGKTKDLDAQLIAKMVANLEIPLHEVIDFIEEESTIKFKKLVEFYKEDEQADKPSSEEEDDSFDESDEGDIGDAVNDIFQTEKRTQASVRIGGRKTNIPFGGEEKRENHSLRDKLQSLSPRQKAYLTDFLDLDVEGKDLMVDIGNSLFRYFKQRGVEF
jgi:transcriptional regulator with XRE-family HTH domain